MISALIGSLIIFSLSILFIFCYFNSNCIWLDNKYLNGLKIENDFNDLTDDNQTNTDNSTKFNAQPNITTMTNLISNKNLDLFNSTSSNFTLGKFIVFY